MSLRIRSILRLRSGMAAFYILPVIALAAGCAGGVQTAEEMAADDQESQVNQLMRIAGATRAGGDLTAAYVFYDRAHSLEPTNPKPLLDMGETAAAMGNHHGAAAAFRAALELDKSSERGHVGNGRALIALNRPQEAAEEFRAVIALKPNDHRGYNGLGVALDLAGDHKAAQQSYREAIDREPGNLAVRNNLALSLTLSGDHRASIDMLRMLADDPMIGASARRNLALAYALVGATEQARAVARTDLRPWQVENNIAYFEFLRGLSGPHLAAAALGVRTEFDDLSADVFVASGPEPEEIEEAFDEAILEPGDTVVDADETVAFVDETVIQPEDALVVADETILEPEKTAADVDAPVVERADNTVEPAETIASRPQPAVPSQIEDGAQSTLEVASFDSAELIATAEILTAADLSVASSASVAPVATEAAANLDGVAFVDEAASSLPTAPTPPVDPVVSANVDADNGETAGSDPMRAEAVKPVPTEQTAATSEPAPAVSAIPPAPVAMDKASPTPSPTAETAKVIETASATLAHPVSTDAAPPAIDRVGSRTGEHPGFSRIVFDWPERVDYSIQKSGNQAVVVFNRSAKIAMDRKRVRGLRQVVDASVETDGDRPGVSIVVPELAKIRHFQLGSRVVIDVVATHATVDPVDGAVFLSDAAPSDAAPSDTANPTPEI